MQQSPQPIALQPQAPSGSFAELATFMKEQQQLLLEQQKEAKRNLEQAKREMEGKFEQQRQQMERLAAPKEAVSAEQVGGLTARVHALHAAQLLSDDELFAVEDSIADFIEVTAACEVVTLETANTNPVVGKLHKLVALGEGMADDAMFARQVRRKFV